MEIFFQQIINGLVLGSMYALLALGYTMVYGVLNLINFAHGDVLMIGAMAGISILNMLNAAAPGLPGIVKLLIAIFGAIPVQTFAMMIWGRNPLPFPQVMPSDSFQIFGALITPTQGMLLMLALLSMIALALLVERSKLGRAMRATAENPRVAGLMGLDVNRVIVFTFAIGAALAAVA